VPRRHRGARRAHLAHRPRRARRTPRRRRGRADPRLARLRRRARAAVRDTGRLGGVELRRRTPERRAGSTLRRQLGVTVVSAGAVLLVILLYAVYSLLQVVHY